MSSPSARCECESMMPGVRYLPPASITVAEAGAFTNSPTAAILPSFIYTLPFLMFPCVTVMTTAFLITTSRLGGELDCWAKQQAARMQVERQNSHRQIVVLRHISRLLDDAGMPGDFRRGPWSGSTFSRI